MSRVAKTFCDCCGKEIAKCKTMENSLMFTVFFKNTEIRADYCYKCGAKITDSMLTAIKEIQKEQKDGDGDG